MGKRGRYGRRAKFRIKLRKKTIYTIFAFGQIVAGLLLLLSFTGSGSTFIYINTIIRQYFGPFSFFLGFVLIFFGFLFFKTKFTLSRPNVALGFLIVYASAVVLFRSGYIGQLFFANVSDVISPIGTFLVFLAGIFIGLVVLFDTSVDEIIKGLLAIKKSSGKLIPTSFFKKQRDPLSNKQMTIKDSGFSKNGPAIVGNMRRLICSQKAKAGKQTEET